MQRVNGAITLVLTGLAVLAWLLCSVWPGRIIICDPQVQMPMAETLSAAAGLGWVLVTLGARRDGETRCRQCRYILRGLSVPRCPECGEAI
jgi:hypothetical protein